MRRSIIDWITNIDVGSKAKRSEAIRQDGTGRDETRLEKEKVIKKRDRNSGRKRLERRDGGSIKLAESLRR